MLRQCTITTITSFHFSSKEKDPLRLYLQSGELCRARLTSPPDLLTGYSYLPHQARQAHHGARYLEHEMMSMWLSVDPMSDKYPSLSPYAYCAWNPVKLVDPDGNSINPVYGTDGQYKGCTKEGFTGEIIIYDGEVSFSNLSAQELIESTSSHEQKAFFYDRNSCNELDKEAKLKMYQHIIGTQDGIEVNGATFCIEDVAIEYCSRINGNWITTMPNEKHPEFRLTITENYLWVKKEVSVGNYTILKTQGYEATVENIISSVIYHEWYGHHICGYSEEQGNHQKCYEASKACPFYEQTTENYKAFVEQSIK